jgi:hypothetical protein
MGRRGHRPRMPNDDEVGLKTCAFVADDAVGHMLRKLPFLKAANKKSLDIIIFSVYGHFIVNSWSIYGRL